MGAYVIICKSMAGNKPFTQEDNFINHVICSIAVKD